MRRRCHKRPAPVRSPVLNALVDRFRRFDRLVEVGIGHQTQLARALAESAEVTATDIVTREVPPGVTFVQDDLTDPDPRVYTEVDFVYAVNLPLELHRPFADLLATFELEGAFTTFGTEGPAVPATPEPAGGATLYWITQDEAVRATRRD